MVAGLVADHGTNSSRATASCSSPHLDDDATLMIVEWATVAGGRMIP